MCAKCVMNVFAVALESKGVKRYVDCVGDFLDTIK